MDDDFWSDGSVEETKPPTKETKPQASGNNWEDSDPPSDDEDQQQPVNQTQNTENTANINKGQTNDWGDSDPPSDDDNNEERNDTNNNTQTQSTSQSASPIKPNELDVNSEKTNELNEADIKKAKKYQNKKKKKRRKKKNKKERRRERERKEAEARAKENAEAEADADESTTVPKGQDEIVEMNSSDSDSDNNTNKKNGAKMQTYEERMRTDNDILFGGLDKNKKQRTETTKAKPKKEDTRPMLSGNVKLNNFPLGSGHDCTNLAEQISGLLWQQSQTENNINDEDIVTFYKALMNADVLKKLDMVDIRMLANTMNQLLKNKQKEAQKIKNPKNKKKQKAQWIVADRFKGANNGGRYADGDYQAETFDVFNM